MANQPATPNRNYRIPDEIVDEIQRIADDQGVTNTEIVLRALRRYIRDYPSEP